MNTQLFIEGYPLDLTAEISALLNFAIDDIKDFSSRSTTWSRTIVLPGTANNNKQFGHIFQVGQSNNYDGSQPNVGYNFNAAKAAPVILFQDQIQTFKGVLRLLQINISDGFQGKVEYEVSIFGNLVGLNSALSGALLEELDFSAYNHIYNDANIVNSWDNPGGSGYYYPLIDYGTYSVNKHDWDIKTFRPGLYAREYIDKMFTAAGYRWQSALFDTPRFKSIIVPHGKKVMTTNQTKIFDASVTTQTNYGHVPATGIFNPGVFGSLISWNNLNGSGFTPTDTTNTIFNYNGTITANVVITAKFKGSFTSLGSPSISSLQIYLFKNTPVSTFTPAAFGSSLITPYEINITATISLAPGDNIQWRIAQDFYDQLRDVVIDSATFSVQAASGSIAVPIQIGDNVILNDQIPQNIRQIDFLVGIVKLYNLYVYEDKNDEHLIYITPYIDFYSKNFSNAVDWTHKLNRNKITKVKPMSELNAKIYKFKFKSDSDYFNDLYRKRYNEGYGDRIYDSEFEFTQQTSEFEICFSATPLVGYGGEEKVYSTIFKQTGNPPTVTEENVDSNIRLLLTKKVTGVTFWSITNGPPATGPILSTLTRYGYAGHLDDPDIPTNDLNFGAPKELFFILSAGNMSNNQFNVYWSNYMREITDKDSKLVTANFYLTAVDILNLDFSKYVYVDGVAFRLNSIKDYDASKPTDCVVELLKVNAASYTESSSNNGPPDGCYLLWSDENTLDWTDSDPLLYGDCATNPGDGPTPPVVHTLNWSWTRIGATAFAIFKIYVDDVLSATATANSSGTFNISAGQVVKVEITGSVARLKRIFESNNADGVEYDQTTSGTTIHTYTFTIDADKDYTVNGSVQNP